MNTGVTMVLMRNPTLEKWKKKTSKCIDTIVGDESVPLGYLPTEKIICVCRIYIYFLLIIWT